MTSTVSVRAPGRVNLIGEHTDYSQLPVMPIAIDRWLTVSAAANESGRVTATSAAFEDIGTIDRAALTGHHGWLRYLAGAVAQLAGISPGHGATVRVTADLPSSGGLSSSSALTVGVLAALNEVWHGGLDRDEIVRRAVVAERHVGVETGGMDQEVIAFARQGHALRIDFLPAGRVQVPLPDDLAFVVAFSGEAAAKGGDARDAYNERVIGARLAALLLAGQLGVELEHPPTLGQVADIDVVAVLVDGLPERVSAHTVAHGVDADVTRIISLTNTSLDARALMPVRGVARHILSEAQRVGDAEAALRATELKEFGAILNASHDSLRQDFRCSTPALDRLCAAMRKAGAHGARLTGAGFGGYALAACPQDQVNAVIEAAMAATGGPAFRVLASDGYEIL